MSLATTFEEKTRVINDIWSKMSQDEKKIMLKKAIKEDLKTYFEIIWDEQKFLEKESGVEAVCEYTSEKAWSDGEEMILNGNEKSSFQNEKSPLGEDSESGLEVNLAGKVSKEAENAYYFDEKRAKKAGNDRFDGFLGYVNSSGNDENEDKMVLVNDESEPETTLEAGEFVDKIADKIEELEMKNKMKNMKFPDFGGEN